MHKYLNTTHRTTIWFKKTFNAGDLVIKAPFQRNPVWSLRQQSSLVETILMEYPVPEIYMQELTDETGDQKHILVDGQQRVRTIISFLTGEFEIEIDGSKWNGLSFEDLSPDDRKRFFDYNLVVRILPDMADEEVRGIFQRLNRSTTALNAQELRHATYWGPFIKLMEEIADFEFWSDAGIFSANDRRRMLDIEFISELSVAVLNGLQNKKKRLEEFYQQYETSFDGAEFLRKLFLSVVGEIEQVLPNLPKTRWRKKSDFYTLFITFAQHLHQLPLPSEKREIAQEKLTSLARAVYIVQDESFLVVSPEEEKVESLPVNLVLEYSRNVERAASDLGSRAGREHVLKTLLVDAFGAPNTAT